MPELSPPFDFVPLSASDREAAARLYTRVFLSDEPTSRRHALDPSEFLPFARTYVRWLVTRDLSFLARDPKNGRILGFIFCFDFLDDPAQESAEMRAFISHFREAVAMIEDLESRFLPERTVMAGALLHVFQIGVGRRDRHRGIAGALLRHAMTHARQRGYRQAVADCTNPASEQTFRKCGFSSLGSVAYESFSMNGVRFFSGLEGGISLMVADLPDVS